MNRLRLALARWLCPKGWGVVKAPVLGGKYRTVTTSGPVVIGSMVFRDDDGYGFVNIDQVEEPRDE